MKKIFLVSFVWLLQCCIILPVSAQKKAATKPANMLAMLQGRWASLEDKKTFFQVQGNLQIDIYGKDILDSATLNFYDDCPRRIIAEEEERVNGKYLVVQLKPDHFLCYEIQSISSQTLVLLNVPRQSVLRFKKVPTINLATYSNSDED